MKFNLIQIAITLFFIYFSVLVSSSSHILLNCSLQDFLYNNFILKQLVIFLTIFVFTYMLSSYNIKDIEIELFTSNRKKEKINTILKYLLFTLIIHVFFILTTLNEGKYLFIVLLSCLCITLIEVFSKNINNEIYNEVFNYYYINAKQKQIIKNKLNDKITNEKDFNNIVLNHNISIIWIFVIMIILFIGVFVYYKKLRKIHNKNWKWTQFIFGNNYCKLSGYKKKI